MLVILGGADTKTPDTDVAVFGAALRSARVDHRVVSYAGAPHSFFDRGQRRHAKASAQACSEVQEFVSAGR